MKSDSLTIRAASLDALSTALRNHYNEFSEVATQSGDSRLILTQRYDFGNNSHTLGVALIETAGERIFLVYIYAGGGRSGLFGIDHVAEDRLVDEMKKILLTAGEAVPPDEDKKRIDADLELMNKYNPLSPPKNKKRRS